jgi:hypothetical protein
LSFLSRTTLLLCALRRDATFFVALAGGLPLLLSALLFPGVVRRKLLVLRLLVLLFVLVLRPFDSIVWDVFVSLAEGKDDDDDLNSLLFAQIDSVVGWMTCNVSELV